MQIDVEKNRDSDSIFIRMRQSESDGFQSFNISKDELNALIRVLQVAAEPFSFFRFTLFQDKP